MEDLKNNKLIWVLIVTFLFNVAGYLGGKVLVEYTADRVIEKLQREYSPAKPPYGPGVNPDTISDDFFKTRTNSLRGL